MGDRLWTGKPPRHRSRHPGLVSLSLPSVAGWNEYPAKPGVVNRHIAWYTSLYPWSRSMVLVPGWKGLASGDQHRLIGSSSTSEACSRWCAIQIHRYFTLLLLTRHDTRHTNLAATLVWPSNLENLERSQIERELGKRPIWCLHGKTHHLIF